MAGMEQIETTVGEDHGLALLFPKGPLEHEFRAAIELAHGFQCSKAAVARAAQGDSEAPPYNWVGGKPMLNEFQRTQVWRNMLAAETRSLYFADLASRYTRQKQWITGFSFFFSSGAAAILLGKASEFVPIVLSFAVAAMTAYSIAVGLDRRIATMAKLHSAWNRISQEYNHLWSHIGDQDAESQLERLIAMEREPSELASTEAPNREKLVEKWQDRVFAEYQQPS